MLESYREYEYMLAATQLSLAMAGMGATSSVGDFLDVFRRPRALFVGLVLQLAIVPVLATALSRLFGVSPGIATGLALIAAVPGGTMSNLITYLGRGNTPLSISLTAVTTLGCLATTPLLLELFASTHLPEDFSMPAGNIVREIAFVLLLPLGAGMFVGTRFPSVRDSFSRWCIRGSLAAIGLIIIGSIGSGRVDPGAHGAIAVLVMAVLPILAQVAALLLSIAARLSPGDALALGIEVTVRNTNLGLLIAASLFPPGVAGAVGDGVFFVALLYGGFALLVAVPLTLSGRRRFRRATSPEGAVTAT